MRALALALVALLLAGCASQEPAATPAALNNSTPLAVANYTIGNATLPQEEVQNATLGAEHVHDLWKGREQIVLLDASVDAGMCEGLQDAAFFVVSEALADQAVAEGCARLYLPEGAVVPEGTGDLEIAVDATDALKSGAMELQFRDKGRQGEGEVSTDPKHTWHLNLSVVDWDLPHANATSWVIYVAAHGAPGLLQGSVKARVVAHKIPGWQPILAVAHVDHWKLPHLHDFAAPNAMRLYDGTLSVTNIDPQRFFGQNLPQSTPFKDIVAPGATTITLIVDPKSSDCAPALECRLVPTLVVGGFARERLGNLTLVDGARRVYSWSVPNEVPEDSVYANVSTTQINPRIDACAVGAGEATCGIASLASTSVTAHVIALAWKGKPDEAVLKTLGKP